MSELRIKRIYDAPDGADGFRALVDRLWPRGMSHDRAELDAWWKDLAPSPELRTEWHHNPERFAEFADAYRAELADRAFVGDAIDIIRGYPVVTLLYGAHDEQINHATVLRDVLLARLDA